MNIIKKFDSKLSDWNPENFLSRLMADSQS